MGILLSGKKDYARFFVAFFAFLTTFFATFFAFFFAAMVVYLNLLLRVCSTTTFKK